MEKKGYWCLAVVVLLIGLVWASPVLSQRGPAVTIGYVLGTSALPIDVIRKQNLPEKYGLNLTFREFPAPAALDVAMSTAQLEFTDAAPYVHAARLTLAGKPWKVVGPSLLSHNSILVKSDSPYQTVRDLKGKNLGYLGREAQMTPVTAILFKNRYQMDLEKDVQLKNAPPPALIALLDKGELAATTIFEPHRTRLLASGRYRAIMDIDAEWVKMTGNHIPLVGLVATKAFAEKNRELIGKFLAMRREAVLYIRQHPEVITMEYAKRFAIEDEKTVELLRKNLIPYLAVDWDKKSLEALEHFFKEAVKLGYLPAYPEGLLDTTFLGK